MPRIVRTALLVSLALVIAGLAMLQAMMIVADCVHRIIARDRLVRAVEILVRTGAA